MPRDSGPLSEVVSRPVRVNYFRQTEIADFNEAVVRLGPPVLSQPLHDEDVCGLEIAVQYAFVVRRFNAGDHLAQNRHACVECRACLRVAVADKGFRRRRIPSPGKTRLRDSCRSP